MEVVYYGRMKTATARTLELTHTEVLALEFALRHTQEKFAHVQKTDGGTFAALHKRLQELR